MYENRKIIKKLEPEIMVSGQLHREGIEILSEAGIRTIINMRPDREGINQPLASKLSKYAESYGLVWQNLFVIPGQINLATLKDFYQILESSEYPMHIFCKSGTRAVQVWALTRILFYKSNYTEEGLLEKALAAGYEITPSFYALKALLSPQ